jgi:hypothetical protein
MAATARVVAWFCGRAGLSCLELWARAVYVMGVTRSVSGKAIIDLYGDPGAQQILRKEMCWFERGVFHGYD